jgi:hypothetical protein
MQTAFPGSNQGMGNHRTKCQLAGEKYEHTR